MYSHEPTSRVCVCLTLLFVQQEVAVLVSASDGVRDAISVWVMSMNDGDQRIWTSIFTQEGLVPARWSETVRNRQTAENNCK